ncbi:MAG: PorT family protein [Segetibacter sp.]|nr:PorT family protein [Segetibacter sp.]
MLFPPLFLHQILNKPKQSNVYEKDHFVAAATVLATAGFSQVKFGAQVIGNASTASFESAGAPNFKKPGQAAFGAGIVAEVPIISNVSLRPSLNYLQKNSAVEFSIPLMPGKTHTVKNTLHCLELPVNIVYSIPLNNMSLYFGAGPSFGYGLNGKSKYKGWDFEGEGQNIVAVEETTRVFKKEKDGGEGMKRFELSASAIAGVQFNNGLFLNAGYLAGLTNLGNKDGKFKNNGGQITIGSLLKYKKS